MSAIWFHDEEQKYLAVKTANQQPKKVFTEIKPLKFWVNAEHYHQKYMVQNNKEIMKIFKELTQDEFVDSEVIAKLNGFLNGENTDWMEECLMKFDENDEILKILHSLNFFDFISCPKR
jgi:peptide-methionine (S)-S-oxide reductase